jgi:hypothetical protein
MPLSASDVSAEIRLAVGLLEPELWVRPCVHCQQPGHRKAMMCKRASDDSVAYVHKACHSAFKQTKPDRARPGL